MNNKMNKIWRVIFIIGLLFTILASVYTTYTISNIGNKYDNTKKEEISKIKQTIYSAINANDYEMIKDLLQKHSIEVNIKDLNNNRTVYSSIADMEVNEKAMLYEERYENTTADNEYEVWLVVYNVLPQKTFDDNIKDISISIVFVLLLIVLLLAILLLKYLRPLREFRNNINKLSEFKLDEIKANNAPSEYNALNQNIAEFSRDLDDFVKETEYKYTNLENQLQHQNEKLSYQNRLVASLTHNLKAPLVTVKYLMMDDTIDRGEVNNKIDLTISEINDISRVVFQDSNVTQEKETFDLVELLFDISDMYKIQFKEKKLFVDYNVDEKVVVYAQKLQYKQLIHNAISNIVNYAKVHAEVEIGCYIEDNKLILSFYNDAKQLTPQQLENIFKLFYRISSDKEGLGTGLFTMKHIANSLGGSISFENKKNGVELKFEKDL